MYALTPHFAPVVVLLFLGTIFLVGIGLLVWLYGALGRSPFFAKLGAGAVATIAGGYFVLLTAVSLASSERVLAPGGWKYFCEIDCHIAYSLIGAETAEMLGPEMQQTAAKGKFVILRLKTWFDERTISADRGNGPLTPNRRRVLLVDQTGGSYAPSAEGQAAFTRLGRSSTPLTKALRPGEWYTSDLVFDVPNDADGLRLLVTEDDPETRFVIGHENSFLHKKIYFNADPFERKPERAK